MKLKSRDYESFLEDLSRIICRYQAEIRPRGYRIAVKQINNQTQAVFEVWQVEYAYSARDALDQAQLRLDMATQKEQIGNSPLWTYIITQIGPRDPDGDD